MTDNTELRHQAYKRIKARRDFWQMLAIFVALSVLFIVIWFVSGYREYFWPMWPMIGFAIATVFSAISAFGPFNKPISDSAIDNEVRKLNGE